MWRDSSAESHPRRSYVGHLQFAQSVKRAACIRACDTMASHGDPFTTFGLSAAASKQDTKHADRKSALKYRPDVCKGNDSGDHCALMFKQVNIAYEVALEVDQQEMAEVRAENLDGFTRGTGDNWEG